MSLVFHRAFCGYGFSAALHPKIGSSGRVTHPVAPIQSTHVLHKITWHVEIQHRSLVIFSLSIFKAQADISHYLFRALPSWSKNRHKLVCTHTMASQALRATEPDIEGSAGYDCAVPQSYSRQHSAANPPGHRTCRNALGRCRPSTTCALSSVRLLTTIQTYT